MADRRFAVLRCEDAQKWQQHQHRWRELLARPGEVWELFAVCSGELPADAAEFDAYLITGSHYSSRDDGLAWVGQLMDLIREVDALGRKLAGCCFGHQVIARALGGEVAQNADREFILGGEQIDLIDAPAAIEWMRPLRGRAGLHLLKSHGECVTRAPAPARVLARSVRTRIEMFCIDDRILGFQAHPELTPAEVEEKILLPRLMDGRLDAQAGEAVRASMRRRFDSQPLLEAVSAFLRG